MRQHARWGSWGAYALLTLAIAAAALAFASLRVIDHPRIAGAGPGYRYYALGVQRSTGPSFSVDSAVVAQLGALLPPHVAAGLAADQDVVLRPQAGHATGVHADVELVTGGYLHALHVHALAGRLLRPADVADCAPVVVLDAGLARALFGSSAGAIGRALRLSSNARMSGVLLRVVGVVPDAFGGIHPRRQARAWIPLPQMGALSDVHFPMCTKASPRNGVTAFTIFGEPPVLSTPRAMPRAQIETLLREAWLRLPAAARGKDEQGFVLSAPFSLSPAARLRTAQRIALYLALAFAALVLAGINVFTLQWLALVRRRQVLQLERVLGATRAFLQRRYVLRAATLAMALLLASGAICALGYLLLRRFAGADSGVLSGVSFDALAGPLVWVLPVLLLVVVLAEALPLLVLLQRERIDGGSRVVLSRADRGIGMGVLLAEVLLAAVMSCAAGWALRFAWQQRHADLGLLRAPATIVTITRKPSDAHGMVVITGSKKGGVSAQVLLLDALRTALRGIAPDARLAAGPLPDSMYVGAPDSVTAGTHATSAIPESATPGWLYAASVPLLAGRNFDARKPEPNAVLIDAVTARALFGGVRAAVGGAVSQYGHASRVIGVTASMYLRGPGHDAVQVLIDDMRVGQSFFQLIGGQVLIRPAVTGARARQLRTAFDAVLQRQAPTLQVSAIESSGRLLAHLTRAQTRQAQVFVLIALFAWAIALSGVTTHLRLYLAMRRRLAAIRSALGAGPRRLYGEVLGGTLLLAGTGIVLSLLAAPWLAQQFALLSGAQVAPYGAVTWIALVVLLLAVFAVVHFPAHRAARAEPAESLHEL